MPSAMATRRCHRLHGSRSSRRGISVVNSVAGECSAASSMLLLVNVAGLDVFLCPAASQEKEAAQQQRQYLSKEHRQEHPADTE